MGAALRPGTRPHPARPGEGRDLDRRAKRSRILASRTASTAVRFRRDEYPLQAGLVFEAMVKRRPRRPSGALKQRVTPRLNRDAIDRLHAGGPGWQTWINDAVRKRLGWMIEVTT